MKCFLSVALVCTLTVVTLGAQTAPGPDAKFPLRSVKIEDNQIYTDAQIIGLSGLKIGQPVNQQAFEEARDRILASGAFESIAFRFGPSGNGYEVVYEVTEIKQVYPVRFENMGVSDEELHAWLRQKDPLYGEKAPGTDQFINRYADAIEEYFTSKGKREPVEGELTADVPGEFYLMFHPRGAMPIVAEVDFVGNKVVATDSLREAVQGVAIGSRYTEGRFRLILNTSIRPAYEVRGRVGVSFPKVETELAGGGVNGIRVIVTVDEGKSYSFGRVYLSGTASMNDRLLAAANLQSGEVANLRELPAASDRIKQELAKEGYMAAKVNVEKKVNDEAHTVDVTISVNPGPQFVFGQLFIKGLDLNGEYEIKRIWGLESGAQFIGSYPEYFLSQIREQGVFDNLEKAKSEIAVNERSRTVDVTLIFNPEERRMRFGLPDDEEPQHSPRRQ